MTGLEAAGIKWIGVVVPAHNEQELLPACIAALQAAAAVIDLPVGLLVVLDACTDDSAAAAHPVPTLAVQARSVGVARRVGFTRLLAARPAGILDSQTWLATTDADTVVPADWLLRMASYAAAGWEAVAGTVRVTDWGEHPAQVRSVWQHEHEDAHHHSHVHGANLGVRADAYRRVGGMPAVPLSEDAQFIAALEAAGRRVFRAGDLPVVTSARRQARANGGFAGYLRGLSA